MTRKKPLIEHPEGSERLTIHRWQIEYCSELGANARVGAALISFLTQGLSSGNMHSHRYTMKEIVAGIIGIGKKDAILAARKFLSRKGVIAERKENKPNLDMAIYFTINPSPLNEWICSHYKQG